MSWLSVRTWPAPHRALCLVATMLPIALLMPVTARGQDRMPPIPAAQLTEPAEAGDERIRRSARR